MNYNPISLKTYVSLFWEVYPEVIKELRKGCNSDLNQRGRSQSSPMANKTPNCRKVTNLKKVPVRKRKNLSDRSILPSQIKRTPPPSSMNYCNVSKDKNPRCVDQPSSLGLTEEDNNKSVIHFLPASTKILTNANVANNIVEMVYYI